MCGLGEQLRFLRPVDGFSENWGGGCMMKRGELHRSAALVGIVRHLQRGVVVVIDSEAVLRQETGAGVLAL